MAFPSVISPSRRTCNLKFAGSSAQLKILLIAVVVLSNEITDDDPDEQPQTPRDQHRKPKSKIAGGVGQIEHGPRTAAQIERVAAAGFGDRPEREGRPRRRGRWPR